MKHIVILWLLVSSFLFQTSSIAAHENSGIKEGNRVEVISEKAYVDSMQIFFSNNGIFVVWEGTLERVNALKADSQGIYAERAYWVCPKCRNKNDLGYVDCQKCDYSLPYR